MAKSGYDLTELETVITTLASGVSLPEHYRDHVMAGSPKGARECHIGPDWLLQYAKQEKELVLILIGTGTHRNTLGIE